MKVALVLLFFLGVLLQAEEFTDATGVTWYYNLENGGATINGSANASGSVTIPSEVNGNSVLKVEWFIFGNPNVTVTGVTIPNSVLVIGEGAFASCLNLSSVSFGNSVGSIGSGAFSNCTSLTNVILPSSLTHLDENAFQDCTALTSVNLTESLATIGKGAFRNSAVTNIILPASVVSVGEWAFQNCGNLRSVSVLRNNTAIGHGAFTGAPLTNFISSPDYISKYGMMGVGTEIYHDGVFQYLVSVLSTNQTFITKMAQAILSASNNYGLATKTEVSGAVTLGVQQVLSSPSDYNLFTTQQVQTERTAGQNDVLNAPNSFSLYTANQIHNLGLGGIVLNRNTNNQLVLNYQVLQSSDLQSWSPYQQTELIVSNAPSDKMFLRVQAVGQ